uniref:solute carrier family 43 member 3-like n=1 Tax=Ciona intestinalis TaxID=7719 RepID=UPI000180BD1B|nr:solute carrier family 43 member 3-like [Ciona intestinalis]|eukprot:XP_002124056.1 solute carrier family 43 member 3-like [Ciona intestinalis]
MKIQRVVSVVTGILEALCFDGVIFGWASLSYVLEKEGYFGQSCMNEINNGNGSDFVTSTFGYFNATTAVPEGIGTCSKQKEDLSLVFTISSTMQVYIGLVNGIVMDTYGTWIARTANVTLFLIGCFLTAASSADTSWYLYISMAMISVGGFNLHICNMQTGNLFPKAKATIITFINGAFDSAASVLLLFKLLYDLGIQMNVCFFVLGAFSVLLYVRTFLLLPRRTLPVLTDDSNLKFGYNELPCCAKTTDTEVNTEEETDDKSMDVSETKTVKACVLSVLFWSNLMHLVINQFRKSFFISSFTSFIDSLVEIHGGNANTYIDVFGILQFLGVFLAPLNGVLIDTVKRRFTRKMPKEIATLYAVAFSAAATSIFSTIYSITSVIPVLELQYFTFVIYVLGRAFLYGGNSAFISLVFPAVHFGKIYGLSMAIGGLFQLLQYPVFILVSRVFNNDFTVINAVLCGLCAISIIHPINIYVRARKMLKTYKKEDNLLNTADSAAVETTDVIKIELSTKNNMKTTNV